MDSSLLIARILYIVMWIALALVIAVLISTILSFFVIVEPVYRIVQFLNLVTIN